jgi:hypothetical protein
MKRNLTALLVGVVILGFAVGCSTVNRAIFGSQKVTVDAGVGALKGWKIWHQHATNGLTDPTALAQLEKENAQVYDASRKLGATEQTISALRLEMAAIVKTNGNPATVQAALDLAGQAAVDNNQALVDLYKQFTGGATFSPLTIK